MYKRCQRAVSSMAGDRAGPPSAVWFNGRLEPADKALLTVTDRGFQVGDGVFETVRVSRGRALELSNHVSRLQASAEVLEISLPEDIEAQLSGAIAQVVAANGLEDETQVAVRVTVSRGAVEGRALLPPPAVAPNLVVQAWRVEPTAPELLKRGLHVAISDIRRDPASPLAAVKTISRAEFVYAQIQARKRGADEALLLTTNGLLAEATSASLFLLRHGKLATPSLDCGILNSTTRHWVISTGGAQLDLPVNEERLTPADLYGADEAFLASSVAGILPVTRADGRPIGTGMPGRVTMALRAARERVAVDFSPALSAGRGPG